LASATSDGDADTLVRRCGVNDGASGAFVFASGNAGMNSSGVRGRRAVTPFESVARISGVIITTSSV
jgi:hypothetical protein